MEEVRSLLSQGKEVSFTPKGYSMLPLLRTDRDSVILKKLPGAGVGDIILVRTEGRYVLHRLISMEGDKLVLQGDGNLQGTETCGPDDVLGTVIRIKRGRLGFKPGNGRFWRGLPYIVRRVILAIYRRLYKTL